MTPVFPGPSRRMEHVVFSGLTEDPSRIELSTAKLMSLLIGHLCQSGGITEKQVGALMIELLR